MAQSRTPAQPDEPAPDDQFDFEAPEKNPLTVATSAKGPLTLNLDALIVDRDDVEIDEVSYRIKTSGDHSANSSATLQRILRTIVEIRDKIDAGADPDEHEEQLNALMRDSIDVCMYDPVPPDVIASLSDDHLEAIYSFLFSRAAARFQARVGAIQPKKPVKKTRAEKRRKRRTTG